MHDEMNALRDELEASKERLQILTKEVCDVACCVDSRARFIRDFEAVVGEGGTTVSFGC